jgi:dTDP-N-acetylfucosamine:lipid II N-acetylfucosaminyltransferase
LPFNIIHIFTSEGLYQNRFINFAEANLNITNNLFVFRQKDNNFSFKKIGLAQIAYIESFYAFIFILLPKLIRCNKIVIHYLPIGPSLFLLYIFGFLLRKTTWVLWGSDLYFYKDHQAKAIYKVYEMLRKRIIRKIPYIACFIRGDFELARKVYKTNAEYHYICYPLPTDFELLERIRHIDNPGQTIKILIGNSAAKTNNHQEVFRLLSSLKDLNIEVICPLSYGDEEDYKNEVIKDGKLIFGNKFIPLLEIIPVVEYSRFLLSIDLAIMNHKRQQALGNILSLLFLGKKVFLQKDTTSFMYLSELGIKIFNVDDIKNSDYEKLVNFPEDYKINNYNKIKNEFSVENYKRMWEPIFNIQSSK